MFVNYKVPKLDFVDKKEEFKRESEIRYPFFNLERVQKDLRNERICKVQELSDLKRMKGMFGSIGDGKHTIWNLGSDCYLFSDDGEVKIRKMENKSHVYEFETGFGLVVCRDSGEWGGALYLKNDEDVLAIKSSRYSFKGVHEYGGRIFVCASIFHGFVSSCSLHEIKLEDGHFVLNTIFEADDLSFAGYIFEDNYLYFYSESFYDDGLYRLNLDNNELELIHWKLCSKIKVNSLLKRDNYIYIYGGYNLIKYNLDTKTYEVFTNLEYSEITDEMHADGRKLSELWQDLIIEGK